jgi:hypothetical protein
MAQHQVLFCPFCRESFEAQTHCPEHELALVPLTRLAPVSVPDAEQEHDSADELDERKVPRDLRPLGIFDPGLARGWVALAALCELAALPLPLLRTGERAALATYELARAVPSLWTLALIAFTVLYALARRRTPRALRSLRVLVPALGALALASLLWAFGRLGWDASPEAGSFMVVIGALGLAAGGLRLGAFYDPPERSG